VIRGWTTYFAVTKNCAKIFGYLDAWLWKRLWKWSCIRFKSAKLAKRRCFNVRGWNFGFVLKGKLFILKRHDQTLSRKYIKIKANASIFNSELLLYFADRLSYHNPRMKRLHKVLKKQNYRCSYCNLVLKPNDVIELHHTYLHGMRSGGIEFIHGHCHDAIS
jgi:hypothetical protein